MIDQHMEPDRYYELKAKHILRFGFSCYTRSRTPSIPLPSWSTALHSQTLSPKNKTSKVRGASLAFALPPPFGVRVLFTKSPPARLSRPELPATQYTLQPQAVYTHIPRRLEVNLSKVCTAQMQQEGWSGVGRCPESSSQVDNTKQAEAG